MRGYEGVEVQSALCSADRCREMQVSFRSRRSSSTGSRLSLVSSGNYDGMGLRTPDNLAENTRGGHCGAQLMCCYGFGVGIGAVVGGRTGVEDDGTAELKAGEVGCGVASSKAVGTVLHGYMLVADTVYLSPSEGRRILINRCVTFESGLLQSLTFCHHGGSPSDLLLLTRPLPIIRLEV